MDESLPEELFGDDLRVKQVFNNLISNALKYTSAGTVEWRIGCERDGDSDWIVSEIQDTGIGIRQENLPKLFGDYYQADRRANRQIEGTGLGLAITKRFVELMDGSITVQSKFGEGSTFFVRLRQGIATEKPIGKSVAKSLMNMQYSRSKRDKTAKMAPYDADLMRFRLGEAYRITGKYKEAQTAYETMFRRRTPQIDEVYLRYGQVLIATGQYDKAKEQLLLYKKYVSNNPLTDSLLAAADWAKANVQQFVAYTVKPVEALSSRNSDYAPAYASSDYELLYFTSARKAGNRSSKTYDVTGETPGDLFVTSFTRRGAWSKPAPVSEVLNSKYEDGACAFNSAYNQIYFTRCMKERREKLGCAIYTAIP